MKTIEVIVLQGLPASGKSTWAKEQVLRNSDSVFRINRDKLREMMNFSKYSKENEEYVKSCKISILESIIDNIYKNTNNSDKEELFTIIIDDTNFKYEFQEISSICQKFMDEFSSIGNIDIKVRNKIFNTDLETCIERDRKRDNPIGEDVIRSMHDKYLKI